VVVCAALDGTAAGGGPRVAIVIDNYNYARFLAEAVASALVQTAEAAEVIVVDDGSTDDSRRVIASYGDRIRPIFKTNGGQASALNAGFAASTADVILFLDSDDRLHPGAVAAVTEAFRRRPVAAKAHYRLRVVDANGRHTGAFSPPHGRSLPDGDVRGAVLRAPDDLPYPPLSGNAFSRAVLQQVMPIPEEAFRILADVYLLTVAPLYGPVCAITSIGGDYRRHGDNRHGAGGSDVRQMQRIVAHATSAHTALLEHAARAGLGTEASDARDVLAVTYQAQRLLSMKLSPADHPLPADRPRAAARCGVRAALRRSDLSRRRRLVYAMWFAAVLVAPRAVARALARVAVGDA
jgi:hypothetical protein